MNTQSAIKRVANRLNDPTFQTYSEYSIVAAVFSAVERYSFYRKASRRYCVGILAKNVAVGATVLSVSGSTWAPGQTLTLDAFGLQQEGPFTITDVEPDGFLVDLTLATPCTHKHYEGAYINRLPAQGQSSAGLNLLAKQDTYLMPQDFIDPVQDSFDIAVGAKATWYRTIAFYDAVYTVSNLLSGAGWGQSQNFSGMGLAGQFMGGISNTFPVDAQGNPITGNGCQTVYRFMDGSPRLLRIIPTPQSPFVLDFEYYAQHICATVPRSDEDAIVDYAIAATIMGEAITIADNVDYTTPQYGETFSRAAGQMSGIAKFHHMQFNNRIVNQPYLTSG